tara:strand:+ start:610 stop:915 length:306 start_codon:yes stop_codon:yes gene_type:complete
MGQEDPKQVQPDRLPDAMFGFRKRFRDRSHITLGADGKPCLKGRIINLIQVVVITQLLIVAATIHGCLMPGKECTSETKQHIANMMTVITTSTFALYAAEK